MFGVIPDDIIIIFICKICYNWLIKEIIITIKKVILKLTILKKVYVFYFK